MVRTQDTPASAMAKAGAAKEIDPIDPPESGASNELAVLRAENAKLRERLAAVDPAAVLALPVRPSFLMSEGTWTDLETYGKITDPATGGVFELDRGSGKVTHTDRRSGTVTDVPGVERIRERRAQIASEPQN